MDRAAASPSMELTSHSEADVSAAERMELTSPSEADIPPNLRGRGRGRARGRASGRAASSSNHPKPKKTNCKQKRHGKKPKTVSWLEHPSHAPDSMEETSVSEETARIAAAAKRTIAWKGDGEESTSSDEAFTTPAASDTHSLPKSSGVFDYAIWLLGRLTEEQRQKLTRSFSWMDLCAGLGTPFIAYEALRRGMLPHGICPDGQCKGLTEMSESRRAALRRRARQVDNSPPVYTSNSALTCRTPKDDEGTFGDLPIADHLFMGIVCVDVSACTSTPKSLNDASGATGKCWLAFLEYLDLLRFEERPISIVLECVDKLGHNRNLQGRIEKGTLLVVEALKERGYVGQWRKVSATHFFLPQRRPRVWALFLKVRGGVGPKAIRERERDLAQAFDFIQSSQTCSHESLKRILDRTPPVPHAHRPAKPARGGTLWQTTQGPKFQSQHGISDEEVLHGRDEFLKATTDVLNQRQQAAVWLELCRLRKKGQIPDWKASLLVSDCGSSVGWLSVAKDMFPTLRPGNSYLILEQGKPKLAQGPLCLALQGIGIVEAEAFQLLLEEDALLRQLAGNAFCANICLVFLVAALLFA